MVATKWMGPRQGVLRRAERLGALAALLFALIGMPLLPAHAMKIQQVKSRLGIEAWLVEDHSVPLMAMRFSFEGGNAQDPAGAEGVANFMTAMMDEGAGDLKSLQFQERMEEIAMRMGFDDSRDAFYGSFETLTEKRDAAVELLRLAINKPRFDADAVERIRKQLLAGLAFAAKDPDKVASNEWYALAFPGHAYGRPTNGTPDTIGKIKREDLEAYRKRVFAKNTLKVVAVGDIDPQALRTVLDAVFGELPAKAQLVDVPMTAPKAGGEQKVIEMDVPQSVDLRPRRGGAQGPRFHPRVHPEPHSRRRRLLVAPHGASARAARARLLGLQLPAALPPCLDLRRRGRHQERGDRAVARRHPRGAQADGHRGADAGRA